MECCLELLDRGLLVSLQDLGAAGLTSAASEMASKGEVGIEIDVARVPLREQGMEPFEIMVSESQERMLCVVEPERLADVVAVCEHWETAAAAIGKVTDGRARADPRRRPRSSGRCRSRRSSTSARSTRSTPQRPQAPALPGAGARAHLRGARRGAARAAALRQHRRSPPALRAVRLRRAVAHGAPPRPGRRRGARAARRATDGSTPGIAIAIDGNGRRVAADPYRGTIEVGARVRGEPRVRRRGAARPDQLPELRQPREAAHRLAADRVGARARRRLPGARDPGRRRQRLALQRGRARGRSTRRRSSGWSASCPTCTAPGGLGFATEGDRIALVGSFAPEIRASELARLGGAELPSSLPECDMARGPRDAARGARRGPRGRALERPRHRRGRPRDGARGVLPGRARSARRSSSPTPSSRCARSSARRPAASSSADRSPRCARSASASR